MAPKRSRGASISVVAAKCAKLSEDWQTLVAKKAEAEIDLDIALIVHELQQSPGKVKACKLAVMGTAFANGGVQEADFPETYIYLPKVARSFLDTWLETLNRRLSPLARKSLTKADKTVMHKILYRVCLCEKSSCIPHHNKKQFKEFMEHRMNLCGDKLADMVWNADFEMQWATCGVYTLLPEMPEDHDGLHNYTSISFNGMVENEFEEGISVTSEWRIENNWSVRGAILHSPRTGGSKTGFIKIPCKDMFEGKAQFQELISGTKLLPADCPENDIALVQGAQSAVHASSPKAVTPPKGARKTLTASQRQALVGLKAMC